MQNRDILPNIPENKKEIILPAEHETFYAENNFEKIRIENKTFEGGNTMKGMNYGSNLAQSLLSTLDRDPLPFGTLLISPWKSD